MNKIKVKKLKLIGAISASIALLASSVTSMTAFADVSPVPGSSFAYDLKSSIVRESKNVYGIQVNPGDIALTFHVTNNPGTYSFSFMVVDGGSYKFLEAESDGKFRNSAVVVPNEEENRCIYAQMGNDNIITGEKAIHYDNFSVTMYFRPEEGITNSNSNFSVAMLGYSSPSLSQSFQIVADEAEPDISISSPYTLGDIDNNGYITIDDASAVDSLGAKANAFLHNRSVDVINQHLSEEKWNNWFPKLIYAETADVDENGYVENEDTQEVLNYYANHAASVPLESLVGQIRFKIIHVKNA